MKKLVIIQTVVPDYRKKVFNLLKSELGEYFKLYSGKLYFEKNIRSDTSIVFRESSKNYFLLGRKFLFQTGIWKEVFSKNIMVLEMNPRIISNWIILIIRRALIKETVLWGHAWPRDGSKSKSDRLRNIMRLMGSHIIVYTKTQQKELQIKMPKKPIFAAPNSVFNKGEMCYIDDKKLINNIIYVGRLTKNKKPLFLVKAFHKVMHRIPKDSKLFIVGEGDERNAIENYIDNEELSQRIKLYGHISDYSTLKKLYNSSLVSVSPGYIGLSITQSFGFGVPMIVSRNENHSPEIEAVEENFNSTFFTTDNEKSLSDKLVDFYTNKEDWILKREKICNFCIQNYSVEAMAEHFIKLAK